jgi:hypothetical protein
VELSKTPTMSFNNLLNMRCHQIVGVEATFQPSTIGLGNFKEKSNNFLLKRSA